MSTTLLGLEGAYPGSGPAVQLLAGQVVGHAQSATVDRDLLNDLALRSLKKKKSKLPK